MNEWKTIDSAPKDGTGFLYFQPMGTLWIIDSGYFDGENFRAVNFFDPADDPIVEPTHWIPLPEPPK